MAHAQVQLVCLAPSLVITSIEKTANEHPFHPFLSSSSSSPPSVSASTSSAGSDVEPSDAKQQARALLIPTLLELLFYASERVDAPQRFLSYVETQHEISIVMEQALLCRFPPGVLQYESTRWKALQVASAGTGAFLSQLAVLTELTTQLARHNISVFQISTYQTDYVLVKVEDLAPAIACLEAFCYVEMESGDAFDVASCNSTAPVATATVASTMASGDCELAVHNHLLSVPDIDLFLVQIDRACVRRHMFSLVRLLFGRSSATSASSDAAPPGNLFLSFSETGDDISVVTYDRAFVDEMQALAASGDAGVMVSPDSWKVVQVGDTNLGFAETGIVAGQTRVLLRAGTMVFYLSTFATDFMMIKEDEWDDALPILRSHFSVLEGRFAPLQQSALIAVATTTTAQDAEGAET